MMISEHVSFNGYFVRQAMFVATKSKDDSTKVGCVLVDPQTNVVISQGFNGFPRRIAEVEPPTVQPWEAGMTYPSGSQRFAAEGKWMVAIPSGKLLDRWERPQKYMYVVHAEANAVANAALVGHRLGGSVAYLSWEPRPCVECAKLLIQAGVQAIVGPDLKFPGKGTQWRDSLAFAASMLEEAGVQLIALKDGEY